MIVIGSEVVDWMRRKAPNEFTQIRADAPAIGWSDGERFTGGVCYTDYNGANINMHTALERDHYLQRKFIACAFDYPFNQLKVKRITAVISALNKDSRRFVEHIGFKNEAQLKNAHPDGDIIIYCMFREDCRWIKELKNEIRSLRAAA